MRYVALIDGKPGAYGVTVPDMPGCTAMGKTIDEAIQNASSAMQDWVEVSEESGVPAPAPRPAETIRKDKEVREALKEGAQLASIPLVRSTGKPAKANLSIDAGILAAIDDEARRRKITRSAFVELMAREILIRV